MVFHEVKKVITSALKISYVEGLNGLNYSTQSTY